MLSAGAILSNKNCVNCPQTNKQTNSKSTAKQQQNNNNSMKFVHLSFIVASGGPTFASAATYACPAPGAPSTIISNVVAPTTISVPIISSPTGLCILLRQNASDGTKRAPVARSYAARGEWEKSPGLFSKTGSGVSVNCPGAEDDETCDITVPPLREGEVYALESYVHELAAHEEAARFLEQVSYNRFVIVGPSMFVFPMIEDQILILPLLSSFFHPTPTTTTTTTRCFVFTCRLHLVPISMVSTPWSLPQMTLNPGLESKSMLSPNQVTVNSSANVPTPSLNTLTT